MCSVRPNRLDRARPKPNQEASTPIGVLIIEATSDPQTSELRLRIRSNCDVISDRDRVLNTRDPEEALDYVSQWLSGFRDAAVTALPHAPVMVIQPERETEREDK